jgi:hypothetical protein
MNIFKHRYLTNFSHYFLRVAFNIPGVIILVSLIRFIYLVYIKKNHKTLYPIDSKPEVMGFSNEGGDTSLQHNTGYLHNHFENLPRRIMQFNAGRSLIPLWPLKALDFTRFINMKVLSIGPRMESELFKLVSMGFQLKNIKSIDIQSYSDLIELADMIKMPFGDNTFDLVIIGYVITYTNEPKKAIDEVIRVSKNKGIVSMCHSHASEFPSRGYSNVHINSSKVMLDFFGENLGYTYFKYHPFDENKDLAYGRSNFMISIKK